MNKKPRKKFDISNKMLAAFVLLAVVVSLVSLFSVQQQSTVSIFNLGIPFTGMAGTNQTIGNVSTTIESFTYINFTNLSLNWGSGYVQLGFSSCNMTVTPAGVISKTPTGCGGGGWASSPTGSYPLAIENLGNEDVTLNLSMSTTGTALFGGTSPVVAFIVSNGESVACYNNSGGTPNAFGGSGGLSDVSLWTTVSTANTNYLACHWFNSSLANNQINVGVSLVVPNDAASTGAKTLTITAYGRTCDGTQGSRVNCTATYNTTIY